MPKTNWFVSLHGGHSSEYCDHAEDPLETLIQTAIAQGMPRFGVTEHAPRSESHRLYREEIELGWTVAHLDALFAAYAAQLDELIPRYAPQIEILKGFEIEVVPEDNYLEIMQGLRQRHGFEYIVGSVHYVAGHIIDYREEDFQQAVRACGGLEQTILRYYETVTRMVRALRPEVVGHLDLIARSIRDEALLTAPPVRKAVDACLESIAETGAILDINTAGYRKGLGRPYPAPWILQRARDLAIPCCFGDDSHAASQIGAGIEAARGCLLACGIESITALKRTATGLAPVQIPLA